MPDEARAMDFDMSWLDNVPTDINAEGGLTFAYKC